MFGVWILTVFALLVLPARTMRPPRDHSGEPRSDQKVGALFQEIVLQSRRLTLIPSPAAGLLIK